MNLKEQLTKYLEEHPLQMGKSGQYEELAKMFGSTAESVRCCIKRYGLASNVRINNQAKRLPLKFVGERKSEQEQMEEERLLWEEMEQRSKRYINEWKKENEITIEIPNEEYFGIAVLADSHIGNEGCDYTKMIRDAETIRDSKYLYTIHVGDIIDNFITAKIMEGVINATTSPKQQVKLTKHWLRTMTTDKILCMIEGNHDWRTKEITGLDFVGELIKQNKIWYCPYEFVINLKFPSGVKYQIYMKHKYSFNSRMNPTNSPKQLLKFGDYDADIVIVAHNHEDAWEAFNWKGKRRLAIRPSSYKVADNYSRKIGFNPSSGTMPTIILNPYEQHIEIIDSIDEAADYLTFKNEFVQ